MARGGANRKPPRPPQGAARLDDASVHELLDDLALDYDVAAVAGQLEPLIEALTTQDLRRIDPAIAGAAEQTWDDETAAAIEDELDGLLAETMDRLALIQVALRELGRPPRDNLFARALAVRAAVTIARRANENRERLEQAEAAIAERPDDARPLVLPLAAMALAAVDIPPDEADEAAGRFVESFPEDWQALPSAANQSAHWLARTLATDERRETMRASLTGIVESAAEDTPLAAAALRRVLAEPVSEDPADDDLWVNLVIGLVQEQLAAVDEWLDEG